MAETLSLLDADFAPVAAAFYNQIFGLWVGSGISFDRAPGLTRLLGHVIEHLRTLLTTNDASDRFGVALRQVLQKAGLDAAALAALPYDQVFETWPTRKDIVDALWSKYSSVLDVRVQGEDDDYLLWTAVNAREEYGHLSDPDCDHLAIALLILEGSVSNIVSANWDGLIEAAVDQLSPIGRAGVIRVVVDPEHVRDPAASATLIKFHGCAVLCVAAPDEFRRFLVATKRQITDWPNTAPLPLRNEVLRVATNYKALMVGLSLQDSNLQDTFSKARVALPVTWPCAPDPPWHVFCEDRIGEHQDDMLRVAYGAAYGANAADIQGAALLRAYPKPVLVGLAMKVVIAKLEALMSATTDGQLALADQETLATGLVALRNAAAAAAPAQQKDMAAYLREVIAIWSRAMGLYRRGSLSATTPQPYEAISPLPLQQMLGDPNVTSSRLGLLGVALALLGRQVATNGLTLRKPAANDIGHGALEGLGGWAAAKPAQIFFADNAEADVKLYDQGVFEGENVVVLHSDDTWRRLVGASSSGRRGPSGASPDGNRIRHVSIPKLLEEAADLSEFEQRFLEEVTL